jgi:hypothetical protein
LRAKKYFLRKLVLRHPGHRLSIAATTATEQKIHFLPANLSKNSGEVRYSLSGSSLPKTDWIMLVYS